MKRWPAPCSGDLLPSNPFLNGWGIVVLLEGGKHVVRNWIDKCVRHTNMTQLAGVDNCTDGTKLHLKVSTLPFAVSQNFS